MLALKNLHHDQRWRTLCQELSLDVYFFAISGLKEKLIDLNETYGNEIRRSNDSLCLKLARLIETLKPFAVHALGSHPSGFLCHDAMKYASYKPPLIVHIRGGAEIELYKNSTRYNKKFRELFSHCSAVIADNLDNYAFARDFGFHDPLKLTFEVSLPGNCGEIHIDTSHRKNHIDHKPILLWPKAFANPNVDPYPIIEAVARLWEKGLDFSLKVFGLNYSELLYWIRGRIPEACKQDFHVHPIIDRHVFLEHLRQADILLSPSMYDGISNVLLEAMAYGCIPIVSLHSSLPKDLICLNSIFFANNLIVGEIEIAIEKAVDIDREKRSKYMELNASWTAHHCDRSRIRSHVSDLYFRLGGPSFLRSQRL